MPVRIAAILFFTIGFFTFNGARAQVIYSNVPRDFAIYPRDVKTNSAEVRFSGSVNNASYTKARFITYQNYTRVQDQTLSLFYSGGSSDFDYKIKLKAGKIRYDFKVIFYGSDSILKEVKNVAIGDIMIIQGQSNAVANQYYGSAEPQNLDSFIRSFGTSAYNATVTTDTVWHLANGNGYYNAGCIGQWGLVMAKRLLDSFGIPLGIMNGAVGGTPVSAHQRYNPQPNTTANIYGRLLYRMQKAGVDKNVRSIFYFQGESDGSYPALHDSLFRILYKDWFKDYKGMQQNYLVQVRAGGCGGPTAAFSEVQRQFEFTLSKMKVISSHGLNAHDGCHYYFVNGYELLGKQLAALAGRDLYGSGRKTNIDPPNIYAAKYSNAQHAEIMLEMRQANDSIFADAGFYNLFYVTGDNTVNITGGYVQKNKVYLTLNKGTCAPLFLTYLGKPGAQPWVKNRMNAGLIGFDKVPVTKPIIRSIYSGCPGKDIYLGEDSISGYTYKWTRKKDGSVKTTAKIKVNITADEQYSAIVFYKNLTCSSDTFQVYVIVDKTPAINLGNDTVLCHGDSAAFKVSGFYAKVQWKQNAVTTNRYDFVTGQGGKIYAEAYTTLGCFYKDSLNIRISNPKVELNGPYAVCAGKDTILSVKNSFIQYSWNDKISKQNYFRSPAGTVFLKATDSFGCIAGDTAEVVEFKAEKTPVFHQSICPYDSVLFQKPGNFTRWFFNNKIADNSVYLRPPGIRNVTLEDSHGCLIQDSISIDSKTIPVFDLGNDTTVCKDNKVKFSCTYPSFIYLWNGNRESVNYLIADKPGTYTCAVENTDGCFYADTVILSVFKNPDISLPTDTTICEGSSWKPFLNKEYSWYMNGVSVSDPVILFPGSYYFKAFDKNGCGAEKTSILLNKKCVNYLSRNSGNILVVFPNPCSADLHLPGSAQKHLKYFICDIAGRKIMEGFPDSKNTINVGALPSGIYLICYNEKTGRFTKE